MTGAGDVGATDVGAEDVGAEDVGAEVTGGANTGEAEGLAVVLSVTSRKLEFVLFGLIVALINPSESVWISRVRSPLLTVVPSAESDAVKMSSAQFEQFRVISDVNSISERSPTCNLLVPVPLNAGCSSTSRSQSR